MVLSILTPLSQLITCDFLLYYRIAVAPQKVPRDQSANSVGPTISRFLVHVPSHPLHHSLKDHPRDHFPFQRDHRKDPQKDHFRSQRDHLRDLREVLEAQVTSHPLGAQMGTEIYNGEMMDIPMSSSQAAADPSHLGTAFLVRNPLVPREAASLLPSPSPPDRQDIATMAPRESTLLASPIVPRALTHTTVSLLAQNLHLMDRKEAKGRTSPKDLRHHAHASLNLDQTTTNQMSQEDNVRVWPPLTARNLRVATSTFLEVKGAKEAKEHILALSQLLVLVMLLSLLLLQYVSLLLCLAQLPHLVVNR